MSGANTFKFVMLPPQTDMTRDWAARLGGAVPEVRVVMAGGQAVAAARDRRCRGGVRPAARGPAGEGDEAALAAGAAGRAAGGVLLSRADRASAGGDQLPRDLQRPYRRSHHGLRAGVRARVCTCIFRSSFGANGRSRAEDSGVVHLPEATALIVGVGGIGAETARLAAAFGMTVLATDARRDRGAAGRGGDAHAGGARRAAAAGGFRHSDGAAHAGDRRVLQSRALPADEASRVLHQYRPRHDDEAGRSGGGVACGRDRRARRSMCSSRSRCRRSIRCGRCRTCC